MSAEKPSIDWDLEEHYLLRIKPEVSLAPWQLRVTELSGKMPPVLLLRERVLPNGSKGQDRSQNGSLTLEERGFIYGPALRRGLPAILRIVGRLTDREGVSLELRRFLEANSITFRGNLPLDEDAGQKLSLIFKLRERVREMDRVELISRRVERFTPEEAAYWYSRITNFGEHGNRWARAGMRLMLGGQPGDHAVETMLEQLRGTR